MFLVCVLVVVFGLVRFCLLVDVLLLLAVDVCFGFVVARLYILQSRAVDN